MGNRFAGPPTEVHLVAGPFSVTQHMMTLRVALDPLGSIMAMFSHRHKEVDTR